MTNVKRTIRRDVRESREVSKKGKKMQKLDIHTLGGKTVVLNEGDMWVPVRPNKGLRGFIVTEIDSDSKKVKYLEIASGEIQTLSYSSFEEFFNEMERGAFPKYVKEN